MKPLKVGTRRKIAEKNYQKSNENIVCLKLVFFNVQDLQLSFGRFFKLGLIFLFILNFSFGEGRIVFRKMGYIDLFLTLPK